MGKSKQPLESVPTEPVILKLSLITDDKECQQRGMTYPHEVNRYVEAMQNGDVFPPIDVVFDGTAYWLWDGFHRLAATKHVGHKTIMANVRPGTKRDAILLSLTVNTKHGIPKQKGATRRSVKKMLTDAEWSTWSMRAIARHVHCSEKYVRNVRNALTADSTQLVQRAATVEVKREDGRKYNLPAKHQKSPTANSTQLRQIIEKLSSLDCPPKAKRSIIAAIKNLETAFNLETAASKKNGGAK